MARPSKIDHVVRTDSQGRPVTAGDEIIAGIRLGLPHGHAAARAGISHQTLIRWRQHGAAARAQQLAPGSKRLTAPQRQYLTFCEGLEKAEAEAETSRLAIIERAASVGFTTTDTFVTERLDDQGVLQVYEQRTVTKQHAPQWTAAAWWLERRIPERYARRVELSGPGGGAIPLEERAESLADSMEAYLVGLGDAGVREPDPAE